MAPKFEDVQPGDQLEMPARRVARSWGWRDDRDPDRVVLIGIVTDRWFDPVDQKDYVGVAILRRGGVYGPPTRKHSLRGLASNGWHPASRDWIAWAKELDSAVEVGKVVPLTKYK